MKYALGKGSLSYGYRLPKSCLEEIINNVTSKHGIDVSSVCYSIIRSRANQFNNIIVSRMQGGYISPMTNVEDECVSLIIQIARIKYPLTLSSY